MAGVFVLRVRRRTVLGFCLFLVMLLGFGGWVRGSLPVLSGRDMADVLAGRSLVIDPGHGGPDPGAVSRTGLLEKDVVLDIALRLRDLLRSAGADVHMTREDDVDLSGIPDASLRERWRAAIRKRVDIANASGSELLISVHANAVPSPRWFGAQVFYGPHHQEDGVRLAEHIQRELRHITGGTDRLISPHTEQYLLQHATLPAVTVEVGFLSNPQEAQKLAQEEYRKRLAWAIFLGISHYFLEPAR